MSGQALRPYQVAAIEQVRAALKSHARRVVVVLPTGAGKTSVAAEIIASADRKGSRVWFIAHRQELILQARDRLRQWGIEPGVIWAQEPMDLDRMVQVVSLQTLTRRLRDGKVKADAAVIIVDECHHATASTYRAVLDLHPEAIVLGLTATPCRADGTGLVDVFEHVVIGVQPGELERDGFLVKPTVFAGASPNLGGVHIRRGDFDATELAAAVNGAGLTGKIVETHELRVGRGKRTIAFAVDVEHSQSIAEAFRQAGYRAEHLDGATDTEERAAKLGALRRGEIEILTNCSLFGEGLDVPDLDAVILARPTKSLALYLQQCGRVLRPAPGKERAVILDHGGNVERHGWPTADRPWSLEGKKKRDGAGEAPTRECPECEAIIPLGCTVCPECGAPLPRLKPTAETDEVLQELRREELEAAAVHTELVRLYERSLERGFRRGWVQHRFRERFKRDATPLELARARKMAQPRRRSPVGAYQRLA